MRRRRGLKWEGKGRRGFNDEEIIFFVHKVNCGTGVSALDAQISSSCMDTTPRACTTATQTDAGTEDVPTASEST